MTDAPLNRKQKAEKKGRLAEGLAMTRLLGSGFLVLARRYRCPAGEIDLVVRRGGLLAFVEVKARMSIDQALEAVTPRSQQRIARAAECFLQEHPELANLDMRFDVVAVPDRGLPRHVEDAWRL